MEFCYSYVCDTLILQTIKQSSDLPPTDFLLQENGDYLLLEDGDKIGLE